MVADAAKHPTVDMQALAATPKWPTTAHHVQAIRMATTSPERRHALPGQKAVVRDKDKVSPMPNPALPHSAMAMCALKTGTPPATNPVAVAMPAGISAEERVLRWVQAVQDVIVRERLWVRRAVVLQDATDRVQGALFGRVHHTAPRLGDPRNVVLSVGAESGLWRAELGVVTPP